MEPKTQNYKEAVQEMDALAYAVLDCFQPGTFSQEKWLGERKADYARLHDALSSVPDEPQRDAYKEMWDGLIKWLAVTDYRNQEYGYAAVTRKMIELESKPAKEGE